MEDNVSDVNFNATVYGGQNDKLSRNKDKKYISEVEQSKNDVKENVPNVNKQFHEQQNKQVVSSITKSLDGANYASV